VYLGTQLEQTESIDEDHLRAQLSRVNGGRRKT
jgi:hypothetical protein